MAPIIASFGFAPWRLVGWLGWCLAAAAVAAVVEYVAHRYVMHRRAWPGWPWADGFFDRHAIQHHARGRVDINLVLRVHEALLALLPVWLVALACRDWVGAALVIGFACLWAWSWTALHSAIHHRGPRWVATLPGYAFLRDHHLDHHRRPLRNYSALFAPWMDLICGTYNRPGGE